MLPFVCPGQKAPALRKSRHLPSLRWSIYEVPAVQRYMGSYGCAECTALLYPSRAGCEEWEGALPCPTSPYGMGRRPALSPPLIRGTKRAGPCTRGRRGEKERARMQGTAARKGSLPQYATALRYRALCHCSASFLPLAQRRLAL